MKMSARFLVLAAMAAMAAAECANGCSGHGDCGTNDQCKCYDGFVGGDCSLRVCPMASAYVDSPRGDLNHDGKTGYVPKAFGAPGAAAKDVTLGYSKVQWSRFLQFESWPTIAQTGTADVTMAGSSIVSPDGTATTNIVGGWKAQKGEAHFMTECAGKGACDRSSGVCRCYEGYSGSSCQRASCPSDCSGHGVCRTVREVALAGSGKRFVESLAGRNVYAGMATPYDYRLWDADSGATCVCDPTYGGIDCSLRQCPMGDDPLTTKEETCGGAKCDDEVQSFSVDGNQGVGCSGAGCNAADATYRVEFTDYNGIVYRTNEFSLTTYAVAMNGLSSAVQAVNEANVKFALESLPNNVTGRVTVKSSSDFLGGPAGSNQYRLSVTFTAKSGNVPDMEVVWDAVSNANTRRSYIFQAGKPVKQITISDTTAGSVLTDTIKLKVFPQDTTLFGLDRYWESDAIALNVAGNLAFTGSAQAISAATTVAAALNSIPAINQVYGKPFAADSNVIAYFSTNKFVITVAMPDKQFGANKMELSKVAAAGTHVSSGVTKTFAVAGVTALGDVTDGNKEHVTCSNRGICDFSSGLCKCFSGYTGASCQDQSTLAM